ncbi:MAG: hypothetical protein ACI89J_004570 [Hyphomicrobiaceae bacterium]|jgi:hypothetical protein
MLCTSAKDMRRGFDTGRRDHWMSLWRRDAARAGQAPVELHMNAVGRSRFFSHGYSSPTLGPARARRNTPGRMRSLCVLCPRGARSCALPLRASISVRQTLNLWRRDAGWLFNWHVIAALDGRTVGNGLVPAQDAWEIIEVDVLPFET